ncbi:MAG: hypothetical protein ACUVWV_07975 [Thermodesulfobacteriota bacterium]
MVKIYFGEIRGNKIEILIPGQGKRGCCGESMKMVTEK